MKTSTVRRSIAVAITASLLVAACSDDDGGGDTTTGSDAATTAAPGSTAASASTVAPATTAGGTGTTTASSGSGAPAANLADVCPDPLVIQTDWFPEAEHGALYQMVGEGYEVDTGNKFVSGPLLAGGEEAGITLEIRAGGELSGTVAATTYNDDDITLAYANTESQVTQNAETPLVSVMAPLEINPQIIYWDPETYPDVETLADLGEEEILINVSSNSVYADVLVAEGTWTRDQVDPSYDGGPARFIAEDGQIAQQGFASAEPYTYENVFEEWGKPLAYQTIHDAGFQVYSQTLAVREDRLEELSPCLEAFVPVVQQAAIDYVSDPARANGIIVDAVAQYDTFWVYEEGVADYSVETQKDLGLVGNGPDDTLGNMDETRIQTVIDKMREAGMDVPDDLVASDLFTNEFVDPSIGI